VSCALEDSYGRPRQPSRFLDDIPSHCVRVSTITSSVFLISLRKICLLEDYYCLFIPLEVPRIDFPSSDESSIKIPAYITCLCIFGAS
jgi:hypothetical protein